MVDIEILHNPAPSGHSRGDIKKSVTNCFTQTHEYHQTTDSVYLNNVHIFFSLVHQTLNKERKYRNSWSSRWNWNQLVAANFPLTQPMIMNDLTTANPSSNISIKFSFLSWFSARHSEEEDFATWILFSQLRRTKTVLTVSCQCHTSTQQNSFYFPYFEPSDDEFNSLQVLASSVPALKMIFWRLKLSRQARKKNIWLLWRQHACAKYVFDCFQIKMDVNNVCTYPLTIEHYVVDASCCS